MTKQKGHPKAAQNNHINSLAELLSTCKDNTFFLWLKAVANSSSILTHELTEKIGLHPNNRDSFNRTFLLIIGRYGCSFQKRTHPKVSRSWGCWPVRLALEGKR